MTPAISFCLIGKNEEKNIETCLQILSQYHLPIVYTDTGSDDRTLDIVSDYTDCIFHFAWCDDFSKARNYCASKAPTDWIWFLDCDERITCADMDALMRFVQNPDSAGYIGTVLQKDYYTLSGGAGHTLTRLGRIYHRDYNHYVGSIHEQLAPVDADKTAVYRDLPMELEHDGYMSPDLLKQKCRRNIKLMQQSLREKEDPYLYYQLGKAYFSMNDNQNALDAFQKGLSFDLDPALYFVQSMVETYGYCLLNLKRYEEALSLESIYDTFAVNADFVFLMGLVYMNNALFDLAIEQFQKATTYQTCVVEGTNSYRAHYNIGVIYECLGHITEAVSHYKQCLPYEPAQARLEVLCHG